MIPEELLVSRIFEQALYDYIELEKKGRKEVAESTGGSYSIDDIEQFLKGNWSTYLLGLINSELKGTDILQKARTNCFVTEVKHYDIFG